MEQHKYENPSAAQTSWDAKGAVVNQTIPVEDNPCLYWSNDTHTFEVLPVKRDGVTDYRVFMVDQDGCVNTDYIDTRKLLKEAFEKIAEKHKAKTRPAHRNVKQTDGETTITISRRSPYPVGHVFELRDICDSIDILYSAEADLMLTRYTDGTFRLFIEGKGFFFSSTSLSTYLRDLPRLIAIAWERATTLTLSGQIKLVIDTLDHYRKQLEDERR